MLHPVMQSFNIKINIKGLHITFDYQTNYFKEK